MNKLTKKAESNYFQPMIDFLPAQLTEGKEWYISYYVIHPDTGVLTRVRKKFNRIKSIQERRKQAKRIIHRINSMLMAGYNPFVNTESPKSLNHLSETLDIFLRNKTRECRADSLRSYTSFIDNLKHYLDLVINKNDILVTGFRRHEAIEFMQWNYNFKKINERTYNNYITFYRLLWNWLTQNNYARENVFDNIPKKRTKQKSRILLTPDDRQIIRQYWEHRNPNFLLLCQLAFSCMLRPKEATFIRIRDISMARNTIFISGQFSKNGKDRISTIPESLKDDLRKLNLQNYDPDYYVFSTHYEPGKAKLDPRRISKTWDKMRENTEISKNKPFYSLRDSGIVQLLNDGISPVDVRDQADHSSLEITNVYTKHANPNGSHAIMNKASEF